MFSNNPTPSGGFQFGAPVSTSAAPSTGFSFGTPASTAAAPSTGFSFGASVSASSAPSTGFSFGTAVSTATAPSTGFSFGAPVSTSTAPSTGFPFGTAVSTATAPSTGFSFGAPVSTSTAPNTGFSFGTAQPGTGATTGSATTGVIGSLATSSAAPSGVGFNFGTSSAKPPGDSTGNFGFTLGTPQSQSTQQKNVGFSFGQVSTSSADSSGSLAVPASSGGLTGFGFKPPASTAPPATSFAAFGAPTSTSSGGTSGSSLLSGLLGATATTAAAAPLTNTSLAASSTGFNFGATTTQSVVSTPALGTASTLGTFGASSAAAVVSSSSLQSTAAAAASSASSVQVQKQMTFRQLEDTINKWTTELEEQEKCFLEQATQVNGWDRIVMENGEKIIQLNKDVEKVKLDQQKLDHELDFIQSQQNELEDLLTPLEKTLDNMPPISYQQHADVEREHTYMLAESLDAQLKRMGQDLKEIIERLNATNSKPDTNDPVQQITKILNAHVVSLMWIDRNSANLQRRVEEISKQMEIERREHEKNFRLAYS